MVIFKYMPELGPTFPAETSGTHTDLERGPYAHTPEQVDKSYDSDPDAAIIREPRLEDIAALQPILEHWIRDRRTGELLTEEVASTLRAIETSIEGQGETRYRVAETPAGEVIGVMGLKPAAESMKPFTAGTRSAELINAFVSPDKLIKGTGLALATQLEGVARQEGYDEVVINSGPRYKDTGWSFWTALYDQPVGIARGLYGQGGDAPVWRKALDEEHSSKPELPTVEQLKVLHETTEIVTSAGMPSKYEGLVEEHAAFVRRFASAERHTEREEMEAATHSNAPFAFSLELGADVDQLNVWMLRVHPNTGKKIAMSGAQVGLVVARASKGGQVEGFPNRDFTEDDLAIAIERLRVQKVAGLVFGMASSSGFIEGY
jgi:hypothetical protein